MCTNQVDRSPAKRYVLLSSPQAMTWELHEQFPGRILTAEITPENPRGVHELGFDALWVHSG